MSAQNRHSRELMSIRGVVGVGTGRGSDNKPAVVVLTERADIAGIPTHVDTVKVITYVTGPIHALGKPPDRERSKGGKPVRSSDRFERPVPIGVSTGNEMECSSGTIACRVTDGVNVYALSNNHVLAGGNFAAFGSRILQPGLYDSSCQADSNNIIGELANFVPIDYSGGVNKVDAAIVLTSTDNLDNATPPDGFGVPLSTPVAPYLDMKVQKYGRTTGLTTGGSVFGLNGCIYVHYEHGTAYFDNQILIISKRPFIRTGDSGSLVVTVDSNSPVGLVFAGSTSGRVAIANRIDLALNALGVTIDGL
ncbi:hypothetical protein ACFLU6_08560 [Acidobacteriota bacterium]